MKPYPKITRRTFIQASAVSGAAATVGARAARGAAAPEPVRVGMVGVGQRGTGLLRALLQLPGVEVPAVCDIIEAHAARAQDMVETARGTRPDAYITGERDYENLVVRSDLDAVITATPMDLHTPVMLAAMRAGKYGGTEVPAAMTLDECWELVKTSEETGIPCMMLENVCYFQNVLSLLRMVREGVFGELLHAQAGYQHDVRFLLADRDGNPTWRTDLYQHLDGNLYPTHPIGPVAQWMNINRGDRFTALSSVSTRPVGVRQHMIEKFGPEHPLAQREYLKGDINTSLLQTANGLTVTLYYDVCTPRPYDLILRLQGTQGLYMGSMDKIYIHGTSPQHETYEDFAPYLERYPHPLWTELAEEAARHGGHGGSDYITVYEFIKAVRNRTQPPQDVYDAAAWSAIVPLSIDSVARGGALVEFPDFTEGRWRSNEPLGIYGA